MRKIVVAFIFVLFSLLNLYGSNDIKVIAINKSVEAFGQNEILQSSPIELTLSSAYIQMTGENRLWSQISTYEFNDFIDKNSPNKTVSETTRNAIKNRIVVEEYICDSVGVVISNSLKDGIYILQYCWIENDKWVNAGEDIEFSIEDARAKVKRILNILEQRRKRVQQIQFMPKDISAYVEYLKNISQTPVEFLLSVLSEYKLVINGEFHRRKASWDTLIKLIETSDFAQKTGAVFMELPSHRQNDMDIFMRNDTLNAEIILSIFRDEQINGWWDKGEFDFICRLWEINKKLPSDKKVAIRLVDFQPPYSSIKTREELDSLSKKNRDTHMSELILEYINNMSDTRNCIFLVGCSHAAKSPIKGIYSGDNKDFTAGFQLKKMLGENNVFCIFQHDFTRDNMGRYKQHIRAGLFDDAFAKSGNKAVGFKLKDSPFGTEPFDGIYEYKFNPEAGTFVDNFDGYLFFGALSEESQNSILKEVFSAQFVEEMKRRAGYMNMISNTGFWFGVTADKMTPEIIIDALN